jgi:hypothetical protein
MLDEAKRMKHKSEQKDYYGVPPTLATPQT